MNLRVVSNSTPLIALARIRRFQLLRKLFGELNIPLAVYNEVVNAGKGRLKRIGPAKGGHWEIIKEVLPVNPPQADRLP